jgi:hypothetical protein
MNRKQEFIKKYILHSFADAEQDIKSIIEEEQILFAEWIRKNEWKPSINKWHKDPYVTAKGNKKTTAELKEHALGFSEWMGLNRKPISQYDEIKGWRRTYQSKSMQTTEECYAEYLNQK